MVVMVASRRKKMLLLELIQKDKTEKKIKLKIKIIFKIFQNTSLLLMSLFCCRTQKEL